MVTVMHLEGKIGNNDIVVTKTKQGASIMLSRWGIILTEKDIIKMWDLLERLDDIDMEDE